MLGAAGWSMPCLGRLETSEFLVTEVTESDYQSEFCGMRILLCSKCLLNLDDGRILTAGDK